MPSAASAVGSLRSGHLEARLAATRSEVEAAQRLRWRVFYDEMGARPTRAMAEVSRDFDDFDEICDHLLVLDTSSGTEQVVGTYRLTRRSQAESFGRYYTAAEYDITKVIHSPGEILELGRSCVDAGWRNTMTMQLLWRFIAQYVYTFKIDLMFGCASLPGIDPEALAVPLSYLAQYHMAPEDLRPVALPERRVEMRRLPPEAYDARRAAAALPPLVKGYLRLGGWCGDGAVVDEQFNTTDVCVIVKTDQISDKYHRHYERTTKSQD